MADEPPAKTKLTLERFRKYALAEIAMLKEGKKLLAEEEFCRIINSMLADAVHIKMQEQLGTPQRPFTEGNTDLVNTRHASKNVERFDKENATIRIAEDALIDEMSYQLYNQLIGPAISKVRARQGRPMQLMEQVKIKAASAVVHFIRDPNAIIQHTNDLRDAYIQAGLSKLESTHYANNFLNFLCAEVQLLEEPSKSAPLR